MEHGGNVNLQGQYFITCSIATWSSRSGTPRTRRRRENIPLVTLECIAAKLASFNGHQGITQVLLERGADIHAQNDIDQTPFHKAKTTTVAQMLWHHGAKEE